MADLGAYYEQDGASMIKPVAETPARQPSAAVQALLTKGACASCHGANFNKPIDGAYPKIAGQHADYLFVALKSYKTEGNATWGRNNGVMAGISKQFSNAELKEIARYMASLPGELQTVPQSKFR
jgi:cytochrome c553